MSAFGTLAASHGGPDWTDGPQHRRTGGRIRLAPLGFLVGAVRRIVTA